MRTGSHSLGWVADPWTLVDHFRGGRWYQLPSSEVEAWGLFQKVLEGCTRLAGSSGVQTWPPFRLPALWSFLPMTRLLSMQTWPEAVRFWVTLRVPCMPQIP